MKPTSSAADFSTKTRNICAALIALMLSYAAISKLADYQLSKQQMLNQVFPEPVALQLTWLIPAVEIFISLALINKLTTIYGLYAALILLVAFSIYISLTMTSLFGRVPCSCGGILMHMSYSIHLLFNLIFIILAVVGIRPDNYWLANLIRNLKKKGGTK